MTERPTHEEIVRRLFEDVWNGTDPETAEEFVSPEFVLRREGFEGTRGPEAYGQLARAARDAFPDAEYAIEDTVAEDDEVAVRWTMTGTHEAPLYGAEPTGERVEMSAIEIDRFEDGLLVETWTQSDVVGLMRQLGVVPPTDGR